MHVDKNRTVDFQHFSDEEIEVLRRPGPVLRSSVMHIAGTGIMLISFQMGRKEVLKLQATSWDKKR